MAHNVPPPEELPRLLHRYFEEYMRLTPSKRRQQALVAAYLLGRELHAQANSQQLGIVVHAHEAQECAERIVPANPMERPQ